MAIELPKTKIPAKTQDPKYLILFGLPKVGKTTVLSTLENNLILDFEQGTTYIDALKIEISTLKDLKETIKAIKDAGISVLIGVFVYFVINSFYLIDNR